MKLTSKTTFTTLLTLLTQIIIKYYLNTKNLKKPIIFNKKITPQILTFLNKKNTLTTYHILNKNENKKIYKIPLQKNFIITIKYIHHHNIKKTNKKPINHNTKQIHTKLKTLNFIHHHNLIQLLTYIFKSNSHLLIYKFIPNNNLQNTLNQITKNTLTLT